jgi:flagellar biosynthesis chaperone FliJ
MSRRDLTPAPRGFAWPLSPLQCKLELALDQARSGLAASQRAATRASEELHTLKEQQAAEAALLDAGTGLDLDLHARAQGLRYLTAMAGRISTQGQAQHATRVRVDSSRAACVALEVQIACLEQVRDRQLQAHRLEQVARDTREADASWLGERHRRLAARARSIGESP